MHETKSKHQEDYKAATRLQKISRVKHQLVSDLAHKHTQENLGHEISGDIFGFTIGNASAIALSHVPSIASVPFKGAGVAMATVPRLVKLRAKIKEKAARQT